MRARDSLREIGCVTDREAELRAMAGSYSVSSKARWCNTKEKAMSFGAVSVERER